MLIEFEKSRIKLHLERKKRLRIAMSLLPIFIGTLSFITIPYFSYLDDFSIRFLDSYIRVIPALMAISAAFIVGGSGYLLYWYLQTGFKSEFELETTYHDLTQPQTEPSLPTKEILKEFHDKLNTLEKSVGKIESLLNSDPSTTQELFHQAREQLKAGIGKGMLDEFREEYEKDLTINEAELKLTHAHQKTSLRLEKEIDILGRRGSTNLALGVVTTLIGLFLLTAFIFVKSDFTVGSIEHFASFLPRLALVIFIEVFAYFFLRLYKAGLSEIKYFQNELTNLESKHVALIAALRSKDNEVMKKVIDVIATTERNHILEKGQTTLEIQKMKVDKEQFIEIAKAFTSVIPKQR